MSSHNFPMGNFPGDNSSGGIFPRTYHISTNILHMNYYNYFVTKKSHNNIPWKKLINEPQTTFQNKKRSSFNKICLFNMALPYLLCSFLFWNVFCSVWNIVMNVSCHKIIIIIHTKNIKIR